MNSTIAYGKALEAINAADADDVSRCAAIALMAGYSARWNNDGWTTLAVEEEFELPLLNPETARASRLFTWGGKKDALAEFGGRVYVVEHKTAGEDISDPDAVYWRRLAIDSQVSAYSLAEWQAGRKVAGTLYDVIRKPTIRPKQVAQKDRAAIASLHTYHGQKVSSETVAAVIAGMGRENGELFGLRLQADIAEQPAKYYQRRTITRLDDEILEFAAELWDIGQEIAIANRTGKHYRNSGACMNFGRPCQFLGICSSHDTPDSDRWSKADNPHRELATVGANALTNSRIKTFLTCRRKHHYRYNLGLQRPEEEESEALQFGTLFHKGLEAWWSCFIPLEVSDDTSSNGGLAVNAVASHTGS